MSQRIYVVSHDYHDIPSKYSVIKEVQHSSVPVDLKNILYGLGARSFCGAFLTTIDGLAVLVTLDKDLFRRLLSFYSMCI